MFPTPSLFALRLRKVFFILFFWHRPKSAHPQIFFSWKHRPHICPLSNSSGALLEWALKLIFLQSNLHQKLQSQSCLQKATATLLQLFVFMLFHRTFFHIPPENEIEFLQVNSSSRRTQKTSCHRQSHLAVIHPYLSCTFCQYGPSPTCSTCFLKWHWW